MSSSSGNHRSPFITWRFAIQSLGGRLYMHNLKFGVNDSGSAIMEKIYRVYQDVKSQPPYHVWDRLLIFWRPVIETAMLSINRPSDAQAQQEARQVFVTQRKIDLELTAAFLNSHLLSDTGDFARSYDRFSLDSTGNQPGKETLLVGLQMNWLGLFSLILVNVILCFGVGILVGVLTRRVDLGIAFTSGVAAVLACVYAVLYRVYR